MVGENNSGHDLVQAGKGDERGRGKVSEVTEVKAKVVSDGQENDQLDGRRSTSRTIAPEKESADGETERLEDPLGGNEEEEEEVEEDEDEEAEAEEEEKVEEEKEEDRCRCDRVKPGEDYQIPKEELQKAVKG